MNKHAPHQARVDRRCQAKAPARAKAERIVDGSGAGVGAGRKLAGACSGAEVAPGVAEGPEVQGGGGVAQVGGAVLCQSWTVVDVAGGGVKTWAAGAFTPELVAVGVGVGMIGDIGRSFQAFRKVWRPSWTAGFGAVVGVAAAVDGCVVVDVVVVDERCAMWQARAGRPPDTARNSPEAVRLVASHIPPDRPARPCDAVMSVEILKGNGSRVSPNPHP